MLRSSFESKQRSAKTKAALQRTRTRDDPCPTSSLKETNVSINAPATKPNESAEGLRKAIQQIS